MIPNNNGYAVIGWFIHFLDRECDDTASNYTCLYYYVPQAFFLSLANSFVHATCKSIYKFYMLVYSNSEAKVA